MPSSTTPPFRAAPAKKPGRHGAVANEDPHDLPIANRDDIQISSKYLWLGRSNKNPSVFLICGLEDVHRTGDAPLPFQWENFTITDFGMVLGNPSNLYKRPSLSQARLASPLLDGCRLWCNNGSLKDWNNTPAGQQISPHGRGSKRTYPWNPWSHWMRFWSFQLCLCHRQGTKNLRVLPLVRHLDTCWTSIRPRHRDHTHLVLSGDEDRGVVATKAPSNMMLMRNIQHIS